MILAEGPLVQREKHTEKAGCANIVSGIHEHFCDRKAFACDSIASLQGAKDVAPAVCHFTQWKRKRMTCKWDESEVGPVGARVKTKVGGGCMSSRVLNCPTAAINYYH